LIIHFVTLDNYPKRKSNSSYRPVQIPSPIDIETLDWETHFENLRWEQGNLFCELELQDSEGQKVRPPVSGYFKNESSAFAYFDQVLLLTTLSEYNRKSHSQTNPKRLITEKTTRPYAAFVTYIDESGKAETEKKFKPVIE
ncbi:MAG: hypothetical protein AAFY21_10785, partial [Cyanobacteria bacterium J06641_2]